MIERIIQDGRPISHVADEAGISRQRLTVWLRRYEMFGDAGLEDRSSRPADSPTISSSFLLTIRARCLSISTRDNNVTGEHS